MRPAGDSFTPEAPRASRSSGGPAALRPARNLETDNPRAYDQDVGLIGDGCGVAEVAPEEHRQVNPGLDKTTLDTELGLSIIGAKASGRLAWTGQFGDRTRNQTLSLKLAIPFQGELALFPQLAENWVGQF